MNIDQILQTLGNSGVANFINTTRAAFAIVESIHVIALAIVFGTILIVDLRLIGIPSTKRPFTEIAAEALKWTWGAFALAVVTGVLLFLTNPTVYFYVPEFQIKMVLLVLAGINMAVFELLTVKTVSKWDVNTAVPIAGRVAGLFSMLFWTGVVTYGRLIGFSPALTDPFAAAFG